MGAFEWLNFNFSVVQNKPLSNVGKGRSSSHFITCDVSLWRASKGVQAAVDLRTGHLIAETDAKMVVQAIKTNDFDDVVAFECVFKCQECNQVAHELAVLGLLCNQGEEQILF